MSVALVTGGCGFFGSMLARTIIAGGSDCRLFDIVAPDEDLSDIDFVKGDICDVDAIRAASQGIDVIYHCAAQQPLARNPDLFRRVNVYGIENLLNAALESGCRKVVVMSSSSVFGHPQNPVTEQTPNDPIEDYGRTKVEAERIAHRFHQETGLSISIIRPRTILGHGRLGLFAMLFDWVADGRNIYVLGSGNNKYQFVHAQDLADATVSAAARDGFSLYNIGGRDSCTMRQSLEGLVRHAGTGSRVRALPKAPAKLAMEVLSRAGLAPFGAYHWLSYAEPLYFDGTKAERELEYRPKWSNVDMMAESYDWYLAHRDELHAELVRSPHRSPVREGLLRILRWIS
jgi:nucleoside-diphosphate-sugar epimerase